MMLNLTLINFAPKIPSTSKHRKKILKLPKKFLAGIWDEKSDLGRRESLSDGLEVGLQS